MASRFGFYSFPGYEFLISTITFFDINNWIADICNCIFTSEISPKQIVNKFTSRRNIIFDINNYIVTSKNVNSWYQ